MLDILCNQESGAVFALCSLRHPDALCEMIHQKSYKRMFPKPLETFEKCQFLFKFKKGDNFNHPRGIGSAFHRASAEIE